MVGWRRQLDGQNVGKCWEMVEDRKPGELQSTGSQRAGTTWRLNSRALQWEAARPELTLVNLTTSTTSDAAQKTGQLSHGSRDRE